MRGFEGVTVEELLPLVREGMTANDVAREYGCTRYALNKHLSKFGLSFMDLQVMVKKESGGVLFDG